MERYYKYGTLKDNINAFHYELKSGSRLYFTQSIEDYFENYKNVQYGRNGLITALIYEPTNLFINATADEFTNSLREYENSYGPLNDMSRVPGRISAFRKPLEEYDVFFHYVYDLNEKFRDDETKVFANLILIGQELNEDKPTVIKYSTFSPPRKQKKLENVFKLAFETS